MNLVAENISKTIVIKDKPINILDKINLNIVQGDFLIILGPSGSGKTTLIQILGLMDTHTSGKLFLNNEDSSLFTSIQKSKIRSNKIGFIFQNPLLINELTVEENLVMANMLLKKDIEREFIYNLLDTAGIYEKKSCYPKTLSMGEAQRAAMARALVNKPDILFADEATANLDKKNKLKILDMLYNFNSNNNLSVVFATHDEIMINYSQKYIKLAEGNIVKNTL